MRFVAQVLASNDGAHSDWVPQGLHFTNEISKVKPWNAGGCLLVRPGTPNPAQVWINYRKTRLHEIRTKSYAKRVSPPSAPTPAPFTLRAPNGLPFKLLATGENGQPVAGPARRPAKRKRSDPENGVLSHRFLTPRSPEITVPKYFPTPKRPYLATRHWARSGYSGWRSALRMVEVALDSSSSMSYRY